MEVQRDWAGDLCSVCAKGIAPKVEICAQSVPRVLRRRFRRDRVVEVHDIWCPACDLGRVPTTKGTSIRPDEFREVV
ncbi:MAG: hypothetical protein NTV48_01295 [Candidatus Vogelbacteria bacterium]|nr:hypothetical protein [Candidatus Vogelbacteria bacterium]